MGSLKSELEKVWATPGVRQPKHVAQWHAPEEAGGEEGPPMRIKPKELEKAQTGELFTTPGALLKPDDKAKARQKKRLEIK